MGVLFTVGGELVYDNFESTVQTGSIIYAIVSAPALFFSFSMLNNRYDVASLGQIFIWTSIAYLLLYLAGAIYLNYGLLHGFNCSIDYSWWYFNAVEDYLCGFTTI